MQSRNKPYPERGQMLSISVRGEKYHSTLKPTITDCTLMYDGTVVLHTTGTNGNFLI